MALSLKLSGPGRALKWVGRWTEKMKREDLRFDPSTRMLDPEQAIRFIKTVMRPGFMEDSYTHAVTSYRENERIHAELSALVKSGIEFFFRAGQRAFDQISSFDLRTMVNGYYRYKNLEGRFSVNDLRDPEMRLFQGMPAVSVIGAQSFPTFTLTPIDNTNRIIYSAPGFMEGSIETTRQDIYMDEDGENMIRPANGPKIKIDQKYAFNRIFAEHGLFGYKIEMSDFNPLTALGGMGMSNLVVFSAMMMASILSNSGKDEGQIFAEAAYYENACLGGLTGFQEVIQTLFNGSGILIYAHNYYGGIGRQLLAPGHAKQVEDNLRLILYNRITGDSRKPVNKIWTARAADPRFRSAYQEMLNIAWKKEALPLLRASATGSEIDVNLLREGYLEHAWLRYLECPAYFGNAGERAFILAQRELGNAVFPLGAGSNNAIKLFIGGPNFDAAEFSRIFPVLDEKAADEAFHVERTITTGQVLFKMLYENYMLGNGFHQIHGGQAIPEPLITIIE